MQEVIHSVDQNGNETAPKRGGLVCHYSWKGLIEKMEPLLCRGDEFIEGIEILKDGPKFYFGYRDEQK